MNYGTGACKYSANLRLDKSGGQKQTRIFPLHNTRNSALLETHHKGFYYSEMVSGLLVNQLGNNGNKVTLKEREVEFIKLACTEKTYKEIASGMCLSPKTIDGYRENLFQKLEIKTRIGLVLYVIKNKIVAVEK